MKKISLVFAILSTLALVILATPVASVAFPGCLESSMDIDCVVNTHQALPEVFNGAVFKYNTFTIEPSISVAVSHLFNRPDNPGGNITIIARRIRIAGTLAADGAPGEIGWTLNGGNGGQLTLIAKNEFFLGNNGVLASRGGNGRTSACTPGNGGNGGSVVIKTVPGAQVTQLGRVDVSGGSGGGLPEACNATNGTVGTNGVAENIQVPLVVENYSLNPTYLGLRSGESGAIELTAVDPFNDTIIPASTSWTTSNSSVASLNIVNSTHVNVTGTLFGQAVITAAIGSMEKTTRVQVTLNVLDSIRVVPPSITTLEYGESQRIYIHGFDAGGNEVQINGPDWPSFTTSILEEVSDGDGGVSSCMLESNCPVPGTPFATFTAGTTPGTVVVHVTRGSQTFDIPFEVVMPTSAVTSVRIAPVNATVTAATTRQFILIGIDEDGDEAIFPATSWETVNVTGSGAIDENGAFTGKAPGIVTITTTLENISNSTNVTIVVGPLVFINVTGPTVAIAGDVVTFTASLRDAAGNELASYNGQAPAYIWATTSGTIYPNGTLIATRSGSITITVQLFQNTIISGSATIFINPGEAVGLAVADDGRGVAAGDVVPLTALLIDKFGNPVAPTEATWTILNGTGQAMLNGRLITPTKVGYVNVYAVSTLNSSLTASGVIIIVPGAPAVLKITPSTASIRPGNTVTFSVSAFDAFGNEFDLRNNVTWRVSEVNVASISQDGLLTGLAPGSVSVNASLASGPIVSDAVVVQVLEPLESQSQQLAAQLLSSLPSITIPGSLPRASVNLEGAGGLLGGLTGLFTAGESDAQVFLLAALALLLIGLFTYYFSSKRE